MVGDSKGYLKNFVNFDTGRITLKKRRTDIQSYRKAWEIAGQIFFKPDLPYPAFWVCPLLLNTQDRPSTCRVQRILNFLTFL